MQNAEQPTGQLAVVANNVVNLYAESDSSSELVSQAIMGQPAWIEKEEGEWIYIRTWDDYHGWALSRWVLSRSHPAYTSGCAAAVVKNLFSDILAKPDKRSDILTKLVITTELEAAEVGDEWVKVALPDGREGYLPCSDVRLLDKVDGTAFDIPSHPIMSQHLVATAKRFVGVPYLWGGTTPFGLDCSGFVQLVYHIHGVALPRDSYMQAKDDRAVPIERAELRAGDLVFFASGEDRRKVTHVGLAVGGGRFIHAQGGAGVTISSLDEPRHSDTYWGARRMPRQTERPI